VSARPPWRSLRAPLAEAERRAVVRYTARLLRWARTLRRWPAANGAEAAALPDATPFVSLYAGGRLVGCYGHRADAPAARLARAFLAAAHDGRFAARAPSRSPTLMAQVAYLRRLRPVPASALAARLEPGTSGVAVVAADGRATLLLPQVAREAGLDGAALVERLAHKAGLARGAAGDHRWFTFEAEEIVVGPFDRARHGQDDAVDRAAGWLAGLVDARGGALFAVDARAGTRAKSGPLHHGRTAVLVRALAAHGGHAQVVARAHRRLLRDIRRALAGAAVEGWPAEPDRVAGTLALALLAGLPLRAELDAWLAAHPEVAASPWHAAQCVTALGPAAPAPLWRACLVDLAARPWAPWTAMAARARADGPALARCVPALVESVRASAPHRGGAAVTAIPETALTAVTVEALHGLDEEAARAARRRARRFLARWQITAARPSDTVPPRLTVGAFPASPVSSYLRADITAHALLALLPAATR
jgi:AMMECR1 domain-containing protein